MVRKLTPPPKEELGRLYEKHGNQRKVADTLGVSQRMVSIWMVDYGLPRKRNRGTGKDSPSWKGGRKRTKGGRIKVWCPGHARADSNHYVYNQILVWEQAHGPIPKGYVIHHLNGVKDDDRLENLQIMEKTQHHSFLHLGEIKEKRIRELEEEIMRLKQQLEEYVNKKSPGNGD